MQYGSRAARVASRGEQEKGTIVTAYVLYCFDGNAVWYCCKLGSCIVGCAWYSTAVYYLFFVDRVKVARYLFELSTNHARPNNVEKMEAETSSRQARS